MTLRTFEHIMYFYAGPVVMICIVAAAVYAIYRASRWGRE